MKELEIHDRVGGVASFCCKSSSIHDLGTIWEEGRDEEGKHLEKTTEISCLTLYSMFHNKLDSPIHSTLIVHSSWLWNMLYEQILVCFGPKNYSMAFPCSVA